VSSWEADLRGAGRVRQATHGMGPLSAQRAAASRILPAWAQGSQKTPASPACGTRPSDPLACLLVCLLDSERIRGSCFRVRAVRIPFLASRSSVIVAFSLGLLVLGACKKPGPPSPEYTQAVQLHGKLYGQKLEEAYLDPQMAEVEALLQKVPPGSVDAPAARQLEQRIQQGRAALESENAKRQSAIAEATKPAANPFPDRPEEKPAEPSPAPEVPDAGVPRPLPGMPMSEFTQRFSGCFEPYQSLYVEGKGQRETYALKNIANCRDRFPGFDALVLIVDETGSKLWQFGPKSDIQLKVIDAGTPAPPAPPPATPASEQDAGTP